jgi:uncharacterized membrane protein YjdF
MVDLLKDRLTSRKLWLALGLIALQVIAAYVGGIAWDVALKNATDIGAFYLGFQGGVDVAKNLGPLLEALKKK